MQRLLVAFPPTMVTWKNLFAEEKTAQDKNRRIESK